MTGRFITFEGIDGAGKSTHIDALAERLRHMGQQVICTREPGGTPLAETLRAQILQTAMDPLTEALLVFAARRDHIQQVIAPALAQGHTVLCDRFTDATFAYQGAGRGFDTEVLTTLENWVQQGLQPALTFWFDLPAEMAAERRAAARSPDRFEQLDVHFFNRVRQGYARRMEQAPQRFARLDASQSREQVWAQVVAQMEQRGW
ncbi:MAG: dTMP kinase [Rhizobacter sp.]|nr:dTMP kinase [Rhizobacter sp.]